MSNITRPIWDTKPQVLEVTTSASGATAILPPKLSAFLPGMYKFVPDKDIYVKLGDSSVDDPDPTEDDGVGQCWKWFGGQEYLIALDTEQSYINAISESDIGTTYLRIGYEGA